MPSILAHILYSMKSPQKIWGPELYLGAQGPDVFFYVNEKKYVELGSKLHELNSSYYKNIMKDFPENFYYGYISHMILDEKLHSLINSYYSDPILHTKFEYNFDEILSLRFLGTHFIENKWWKILKVNNIEKISKAFDLMLKKEFGIKNVSYKYAYEKMLKNIKILFNYPYFKKNVLSKLFKFFGKDYTYLYPEIVDEDRGKLIQLEKEFLLTLKGD
ncbi:zinc dependent phospholipase C family protein [Marinitoga lauensis]|uniref:zinc dependent phospholipase C family protein n=1 Tax=Marinitoga lauensis TaxID=2201189 RepID=UPI0010103333|nr:zinc dependent phospholipase C family protein [Marinitoga lauensis]